MNNISKFDHLNGKPDEEQINSWAEEFFFNLLNVLNAFFSNVDIKDAAERMSLIPFDKLAMEQLEDESDEVKALVSARVCELAQTEVDFLKAYSE